MLALGQGAGSGSARGSHCARRNLDAELQEQLIGDACLSPGRILANHLGDQPTKT